MQAALLVFIASSVSFFFLYLIPGDPALIVLGGTEGNPSPQQIALARKELGLDRPVLGQYVAFLGNAARGDLGRSFIGKYDVARELGSRLPRTLMVVIPASILAIIVGIPAGTAAARHRGSAVDILLSVVSLVGYSIPVFVVGTMLVAVFSINLQILPPSGFVPFTRDISGALARLVLPVVSLALMPMATIMRMTRSSVLEELHLDYVTTAKGKGASERTLTYHHILRNALIPVITVFGLQFAGMFAGSVIIEQIFNWPGVSQLLLDAISVRDYPVVRGAILLISAVFVLVNLLTDLTYSLVDPRIRIS